MNSLSGVVIGIVEDVDDPDQQGRIRMTFPWMGSEVRSAWAPVRARRWPAMIAAAS